MNRASNLLFGVILLLSGCLFKPVKVSTRHFVLAPIPASEGASAAAEPMPVGVGFVKMPAYLLRDAMALRKSTNEIEYLEDALWAERLDKSFQQTLAADLSTLLPSDRVYLSAWERGQVKMRVYVNVEQFDVDTLGHGVLTAWWRLSGPDNNEPLKSGRASLAQTGPAPNGNPQVIATTLSALTAEFSRELVRAIREAAPANP